MGDLKQIVWGTDGIGESVLSRFWWDIDKMDISRVRTTLNRFDRELSFLEEETDYKDFCQLGGKENLRAEQATEAENAKALINQPDGVYPELVARFRELATEPLDKRAADLRSRRSLYDSLNNQPEFIARKDATHEAFRTKSINVNGVNMPLNVAWNKLATEPDAAIREKIYTALSRDLGDIETLFFDEIQCLNGSVPRIASAAGHGFTNFFEVSANYCESPSPEEIGQIMRRFVEGTRPTYNKLVRELVSKDEIKPWDYAFLRNTKDPFSKLPVSEDPNELFNIGLSILDDLGYDRELLDDFYNPQKPGVFLDIERREGKTPGAGTFTLGPLSVGKNMLYCDPTIYTGKPRARWSVFPHEFGHGLHNEFSRRVAAEKGAVFFWESTPAAETISEFHEGAAFDPEVLTKYLGVSESDASLFAKWDLLNGLRQVYGIAEVALGELAIHSKGVEFARAGALEAERFTKPDVIKRDLGKSTFYLTTHHLHSQPGYYFAYFMAALNRDNLVISLAQKNGTLFSPKTARDLVDKIMIGNVLPITDRIANVTGNTDLVQGSIDLYNTKYAELCK